MTDPLDDKQASQYLTERLRERFPHMPTLTVQRIRPEPAEQVDAPAPGHVWVELQEYDEHGTGLSLPNAFVEVPWSFPSDLS